MEEEARAAKQKKPNPSVPPIPYTTTPRIHLHYYILSPSGKLLERSLPRPSPAVGPEMVPQVVVPAALCVSVVVVGSVEWMAG
jgi:hypothetical protein